MSAQDELPPGCTADNSTGGRFPWRIRYHSGEVSLSSYMHRHEIIEWAQARYDTEELATMRAAVERCAELEAELARITAERDEAREIAEEIESMMDDPQVMPWHVHMTIFARATPARGDR